MITCPVCELELPDPVPPFCPRCAWNLKDDPTLTVFLSPIPDEVVEEYRQRFGIARENWRRIQEAADHRKEMENAMSQIQKRLVEIEGRESQVQNRLAEIESRESELNRIQKRLERIERRMFSLRSEPGTLSEEDIKDMLAKFDFFDRSRNRYGNFENVFVERGDGTVTDRATGLMWQQSGSDNYMSYEKCRNYIGELSRKRFAGYTDWRLPTIEELASLIENEEMNGDLYTAPMFDEKQRWCWSADKRESEGAWAVSFSSGDVGWGVHSGYVRAVRSR